MAESGSESTSVVSQVTDAIMSSKEQSPIVSKMKSDLAARAIRNYQKERVIEERLKKKIMKSMLSTEHPDTTQFVLDQAEASLVKVREFIEKFFGYDNSGKALMELWMKVQQLLDLLDPFQQLPGVVIPGVGDITGMVEEFIVMQKIIWEYIPAEQREQIKKQIEEDKKSKEKPSTLEKLGEQIEKQAQETWDAVQILIDELPRIKEDLYMMCLENAWGTIMKVCKLLGIPIDVFPFDLLAELPEISKLSRELRQNGKKMIKEAFTNTMAPIYAARNMIDSIPTEDELKLSVVCMSLVDNKLQTEYQQTEKKIADLEYKKQKCEQQIKVLKKQLEYTEKRIGTFSGSALGNLQSMFDTVKKETENRIGVLSASIDRIETKLPLEEKAREAADKKRTNKPLKKKIAQVDFDKAKKIVDQKNIEFELAQKAREEDKQKKQQYIHNTGNSEELAAVEGDDSADPTGAADQAVLNDDETEAIGREMHTRGTLGEL